MWYAGNLQKESFFCLNMSIAEIAGGMLINLAGI